MRMYDTEIATYQKQTEGVEHECKSMEQQCVCPDEVVREGLENEEPLELFFSSGIGIKFQPCQQSCTFGIRELSTSVR